MSARSTADLTRHLIQTCNKVRHASTAAVPQKKAAVPEHGQQIYVYHQFQKNQIVYSLSKSLKNNPALRQLPFNGKKTVPHALRKDLWAPLALISFPPGASATGLSAFQKLREYRKLHELSWDDSLMTDEDGKTLTRKKRGRKICDQKANSVADIAAVLGKLGTPEGDEIGLKSPAPAGGEPPKVEVKWSSLLDAQFAETWTENVIHDQLEPYTKHRVNAYERAKQLKEQGVERPKVLAEKAKQLKAREEERQKQAEAKTKRDAEKREQHLATKDDKHAQYLADRGLSAEEYEREVQALLAAKAERQQAKLAEQALPEPERAALKAERKRLAELTLEEEKTVEKARRIAAKAERFRQYLASRDITEEEYRREQEELARVRAEEKAAVKKYEA